MTAPVGDLIELGGGVDLDAALGPLLDELREVARKVKGLSGAFAGPVDRLITQFLRQQFATQGAAGGTPWAPLATRTLAERKRRGRGRGGILRDTNRLWGSLTKSGGPESIREITDAMYRRGTSVPYAAAHQTGVNSRRTAAIRNLTKNAAKLAGRRARSGRLGSALTRYTLVIPARPIVPDPLPPALVAQLVEAFRAYLTPKPKAGGTA